MIRVLYLHPPSSAATRIATALDAAARMIVHTATTADDARDALDQSIDCVVIAFGPTDWTGIELQRVVADRAPDLPQVLAPVDDTAAVDGLIDRIVAAVGVDTSADTNASSVSTATILDAIPGIGLLVAPDGEIRQWNSRAAAVWDDDVSLRGAGVTAIVVPDARERLAEALATGQRVVEAPVETPAGGRIDHEWTLTRVAEDSLVVVGLDVSERAAFAAELRATEASLAALYETLSDRDLTFEDRLGRVLELGCDRLGVDYGFLTRIDGDTQRIVDSRGTHPSLQPGEQCPLSRAYCRKTIQGEGLLGVHNAVAAGWADDPAYDAFGLGCYLGGKVIVDGDLYGTLCFADADARETAFSDVERIFVELLTRWVSYELEERAAREKLERKNERLSEFASIVSHDLRNPLNIAQGQLELARETGAADHLTEADDALDRMERLVTDLLELARQGSVIESAAEVRLGDVADDAWASVATGDADLVVESDGRVTADRERLQQLLENLFRNSVEHGSTSPRSQAPDDSVEHGSDPLTVRVGVIERGFYVEDMGPGIPADERDAVFDRGYSTNDGTGLGLTIVQAIAEAHGWSAAVVDGTDGGARFEFSGVDCPVPA
ncbi:GAF domain-containing sensor histidine kinase [Haloplanus natans]|uniref:GAF domain-containing sensor histidine kinase n=1 Tax=Haloplanus natans TaxID=376171 RepID=UPI0006780890|nr:GAF domain-containing sensor histidine kinase [Haloplanus natans]